MAFTLEINTHDLRLASRFVDNAIRGNQQVGRDIMKEFGTRVRRYARENARQRVFPRRNSISEDLAGSIIKRTGKDYVSVEVLASYGAAMETGTKKHFEPNHPYFSQVEHPGAQGYPIQGFASRSFNRGINELREIATKALEKENTKLKLMR